MLESTRSSAPGVSCCSASQSRGGKNMSRSIGITNTFAVIRPSAAARSPSVWRATSPRCHFQPIVSRAFGSIIPNSNRVKFCWNSSNVSQPSPSTTGGMSRQNPDFQKSVVRPSTAQMSAWRAKPAATSVPAAYSPPFQPGSEVMASIKVRVNR